MGRKMNVSLQQFKMGMQHMKGIANVRVRTMCGFFGLFALMSCTSDYEIEGTSSLPELDGEMLYLKVVKNDDLVSIDSCKVKDGMFRFSGKADSAQIATLYGGSESLMPIVLEKAKLQIAIGEGQPKVTGSELNTKLYDFIEKKDKLDEKMRSLSQKESQMIMNGEDPDAIQMKLSEEARSIANESDFLVTSFISDNSDNILGAGMFMILTSAYEYPILTPQIEDILIKAKPYFKNNEYVKAYLKTAEENMKLMQNADLQANRR